MKTLRHLIFRHATGTANAEERASLETWAEVDASRRELLSRLSDPDYVARQLLRAEAVDPSPAMADMHRRIKASRNIWRRIVLPVGAAVAAVVVVGSAVWYMHDTRLRDELTAQAPHGTLHKSFETIVPGKPTARLTASNGVEVQLGGGDTVLDMTKARDYPADAPAKKTNPVELCLDVPRGGEFKVLLEDSTEVWLNAQSRLYYPDHFTASERRVRVDGEAYFAVRHEEGRPFKVEAANQLVQVYGTRFNIRAYADEPYVFTTLVDGKVAVSPVESPNSQLMLSPAHQSLFQIADSKLMVREIDPVTVTSWRDGRFVFEEQPLGTIMRDLARWYDFEYEFDDDSLQNTVFMGSMPRYADFKTVMAFMEKTGDIKMKLSSRGSIRVMKAR